MKHDPNTLVVHFRSDKSVDVLAATVSRSTDSIFWDTHERGNKDQTFITFMDKNGNSAPVVLDQDLGIPTDTVAIYGKQGATTRLNPNFDYNLSPVHSTVLAFDVEQARPSLRAITGAGLEKMRRDLAEGKIGRGGTLTDDVPQILIEP